ncbi:MAG: hypothetical protein E6I96_16845 [Chloroflexi bacterium]|nr:MAG: hypothetical protein E6I96_16845 [Chloroflexota bacterium]
MEGARTKTRRQGQSQEKRKAAHEADHGERDRSPRQRDAGEACAETVGEQAEERLRDRRHAGVGKADQADGGEAEVELSNQQRVEDRDDADVAVDREVAEHQGQQLSVAEEFAHVPRLYDRGGGRAAA